MSLKSAAFLDSQLLLLLVDSVNIYSTRTHFSVRSSGKFISPVITSEYYFTVKDRLLSAFRDFKNNTIWFLTQADWQMPPTQLATHFLCSMQEDLFYRCFGVNYTVKLGREQNHHSMTLLYWNLQQICNAFAVYCKEKTRSGNYLLQTKVTWYSNLNLFIYYF